MRGQKGRGARSSPAAFACLASLVVADPVSVMGAGDFAVGATMIIAVLNMSKACPQDKVDFWAAACNEQMFEACAAWGVVPTPVVVMDKDKDIPNDCRIMAIVDAGLYDLPGSLGYHTDALGDVYGRVLYQGDDTSITLSHECLEEVRDPTCDQWWTDRSGRKVAMEVCDPVEGDWYTRDVIVAGETRSVKLSNYVYDTWGTGGVGPWDYMHRLQAAGTMTANGYMVVIDGSGEHSLFESRGRAHALARRSPYIVGRVHPDKVMASGSRTLERLRQ